MSLLRDVSELLAGRGVAHAVIGATALAVHGVSRSTAGVDVLALDDGLLEERGWSELRARGVEVVVRRGDAQDPLAGVIRIWRQDESAIDVIVGRGGWQAELIGRARPTRVGDAEIPVVECEDLVLLKLYAGGPQDAWDVDQLLTGDPALASRVEPRLAALPESARALWARVLRERGDGR